MERIEIEAAVIGSGVIGLATAARLAMNGVEAFVFDRASTIGAGISSRNSEVVHSGIYYDTGSLKHLACVEGRRLLYAYCDQHGVDYRKCGKLVVATTEAEMAKIESIARRAVTNDVENCELLDRAHVLELEPAVNALAALYVRETGIIDSHAYMLALTGDIEAGGGGVLLHHRLTSGRVTTAGFELEFALESGESLGVTAQRLIVAAGPWTHAALALIEGIDAGSAPKLTLAKGSYFSYGGRPAFTRLIYPAPVDGGLGTHLTLDLNGRMRFGPDVEWLDITDPDAVNFQVEPKRSESFYAAIRRYWPDLPDGSLVPDYSGVRPKLSGPGAPAADFRIVGPAEHGTANLLYFLGIESPGLTSSLALADRAAVLLSS